MEMRDVYLRDGTFTGLSIPKHQALEPGQYGLHAIVILKTPEGGYIMQQRSLKAKHYPGKWDVTGGGVMAGETSAQAAVREAWEELGVQVDKSSMRHMLREITEWGDGTGLITDTYAAIAPAPVEGFRIEQREVNDVKVVSFDEFVETVTYNKTEAFRSMLGCTITDTPSIFK